MKKFMVLYMASGAEFEKMDAVEKVGSSLPERNNGIKTSNILNRCCVFASSLESMLLGKAPKIVFRQYRPKADMRPLPGSTGGMPLV
jgi:hypothetical protein